MHNPYQSVGTAAPLATRPFAAGFPLWAEKPGITANDSNLMGAATSFC